MNNPLHVHYLHEKITLKGRTKQFRLNEPLTKETKGKMKHYESKHYMRSRYSKKHKR
jgi:hypothetical protein